jgi:hypothetical protein
MSNRNRGPAAKGFIEIDPENPKIGLDLAREQVLIRAVAQVSSASFKIANSLEREVGLRAVEQRQREITKRAQDRVFAARATLVRAKNAYSTAKMKSAKTSFSLRATTRDRREREVAAENAEKVMNVSAAFLQPEVMLNQVVAIQRFGSVARNTVITWEPTRRELSWVTDEIFITRAGSTNKAHAMYDVTPLLPLGQYHVKVRGQCLPSEPGRVSSVWVRIVPYWADGAFVWPPADGRGGCVHPHISGDRVCLGTAQGLLIKAMRKVDLAEIVRIITQFLRTYVYDNAYVMLDIWALNEVDNSFCTLCTLPSLICGCSYEGVCVLCGRKSTPETLADCGSCNACCLNHHSYSTADRMCLQNHVSKAAALYSATKKEAQCQENEA